MAILKVVKGSVPGQIIELSGDKMRIGRHPSCEIVLDHAAVSRYHAQILQSHGTFYVEDLRSRNRTFVNNELSDGRVELRDGDKLKVCDVVFRFYRDLPPGEGGSRKTREDTPAAEVSADGSSHLAKKRSTLPGLDTQPEGEAADSSIISTLSASSNPGGLMLGVKPEAKLRAVLEISSTIARTLQLDDILQKTLDGLFKIFAQADEGFVLLRDPLRNKLTVRATKTRYGDRDDSVRISMTIVKQAMEEKQAILSADAVKDDRFDLSESLSELQIRSMMCVPLVEKSGEVLGVVQVDTKDLGKQFSQDDLEVMGSVASQISLAVENAFLHEELISQHEIDRDLEVATQIQLSFLPGQTPKVPCYEFADYYESALHVGGDYFDYVMLPDGRVAVALGDVAGKGIPAALLMARVSSLARFHLLTKPSAAEAVTGLNSEIASSGLGHRFITFVVAVLDPRENRVTIANAGHFPPLMIDHRGEVREVAKEAAGMPLGILPDQEFGEAVIPFEHGDLLTLYTDGVTEAMNPDNELYGKERLGRYLSEARGTTEEAVAGVIADIDRFSDDRPQRDDICLVCIRRCE